MSRNLPLLLLLCLPLPCAAGEPTPSTPPEGSANYCGDPAIWDKYDGLLRQVPNDPLVIRSYALRIGLCRMIDEGKISLDQGVEVFDVEKARLIMQRAQERAPKARTAPTPEADSRG